MQGVIDTDGNRITTLPAPGAPADPARLAELTAHAALFTGVHALLGEQGFSVHQTSAQSIPTTTFTKLNFHVKAWDVGSRFNLALDRFVPDKPGKYHFDLACYLDNLTANSFFLIHLYKNGLSYKRLFQLRVAATQAYLIAAPATVQMNGSSDYVEAFVYQSTGAPKNTGGAIWNVWFQGFLIPQAS